MRTPPKMTMTKDEGSVRLYLDGLNSGLVNFCWWGNDVNLAWVDLVPHKSLTGIHSGFYVNFNEGDCEHPEVTSYFEKIEIEKQIPQTTTTRSKSL